MEGHLLRVSEGISASLSWHRAVRFFVHCPTLRDLSFKSVLMNGVLFLLSYQCAWPALLAPALQRLRHALCGPAPGHAAAAADAVDAWAHALLVLTWVFPLFLLTYAVNLGWFQAMAEDALRYHRQERERELREQFQSQQHLQQQQQQQQQPQPKRLVQQQMYRVLVLVMLLAQVWMLYFGIPGAVEYASKAALRLAYHWQSTDSSSWPEYEKHAAQAWFVLVLVFKIARIGTRAVAFGQLALLYSLCCFEHTWNAQDIAVEKQFSTLENDWAFYLGFGMPHAVAAVTTSSYFVAYAVFSLTFSISITLATLTCHDQQLREREEQQQQQGDAAKDTHRDKTSEAAPAYLSRLRMFRLAQRWALLVVRRIDAFYRPAGTPPPAPPR